MGGKSKNKYRKKHCSHFVVDLVSFTKILYINIFGIILSNLLSFLFVFFFQFFLQSLRSSDMENDAFVLVEKNFLKQKFKAHF